MTQQALPMEASVEQIVTHYAQMVYRLAFARMGATQDAEDVFQEVFLRYVKARPAFTDEEHRKAWLLRVTINCCNTMKASLWRKRTQPLTSDFPFEIQENQTLYAELQKLPEKYREVIHLFYYEDLSIEQISTTLQRKPGAIRTQLTRARAMLKDFMKEEDYV